MYKLIKKETGEIFALSKNVEHLMDLMAISNEKGLVIRYEK